MAQQDLNDPDLTLDDLMTLWPQTIPVFIRHKMLCVGCMVSPFHTVQDACTEYALNIVAFYAELNAAVSATPETE
jgi:hybrid cluster-associated redox disulfide protein